MEKEKIFKDNIGQDIYLTFSSDLFSPFPRHVLVVPVYEGKLLFTCHMTRGWELPGGKVERNESAVQAAIRETWEETGATIVQPKQIGEYRVSHNEEVLFHKAIFLAHVKHLGEIPQGFETKDRKLFSFDVDTSQPNFSPFVQDQVFTSIQDFLLTHIPTNS